MHICRGVSEEVRVGKSWSLHSECPVDNEDPRHHGRSASPGRPQGPEQRAQCGWSAASQPHLELNAWTAGPRAQQTHAWQSPEPVRRRNLSITGCTTQSGKPTRTLGGKRFPGMRRRNLGRSSGALSLARAGWEGPGCHVTSSRQIRVPPGQRTEFL